ncbi:signal peptidase II [bacterium]|nr:signal peptidase II [bacterium]
MGIYWKRCATPVYLAASVAIVDQLSKFAVKSFIAPDEIIEVLPCFNLVFRLNPGVAFSMLDNINYGHYILAAVALVVILFILSLFLRGKAPKSRNGTAALGLIMGGALGNMIDRLLPPDYAVVDFIDLYYKNHHWPAFNFADSCITVSALLLIVVCWKED